jgi:hypothetical protein
MQKTRLLSATWPAVNLANFPSALFSIQGNNVVGGDGVSAGLAGTGYMTDAIGGGVYVPADNAHGLRGGGVDADGNPLPFGVRTTGAILNLISGAMPTIGDKNPLFIVVRRSGGTTPACTVRLGDPSGATGLAMQNGNGGFIGVTATNKVTLGAITNIGTTDVACGVYLDRNIAAGTDVAGAQEIVSVGTVTTAVGAGTDGDATPGNLLITTFPAFATGLLINSADQAIRGIYLLAFDSSGPLQPAWLAPILHAMCRNPWKGLHPLLAGLT